MNNYNIDPNEIEKFSQLSNSWWDPHGPFKPLHHLNPKRIEYIRTQILTHFKLNDNLIPFDGLSLIDVGCGGGLISEPMSRLGANVTAIDASCQNIGVAKFHAEQMGLEINYLNCSSEELIDDNQTYDIILALEIIEHVPNPEKFIEHLIKLSKPNTIIIISTINRSIKAYLGAIIGAEYLLRWLPQGTHSWKKFLKPSEISGYFRKYSGVVTDVSGLTLDPFTFNWSITKNLDINYMLTYTI